MHGDAPLAGSPVAGVDGQSGSLTVRESDKTGRDFRGQGLLSYVGERYLRFLGSQEYFLKAGADSPENLLGYFEFDDTVDHGGSSNDLADGLHHFAPHVADFRDGDVTWQAGKGKGLIGALNYLAGQGVNSLYFLTLNVGGDGDEVYPFSGYDERERYDVSKLAQWEVVFRHMDELGLMLHVVTQETECDQLLDQGELGRQRKLYYREPQLDGVSLQMGSMNDTHAEVIKWLDQSATQGHAWFACLDEIGPADVGVKPDAVDAKHDDVRQQALWGNLMAGGAGAEWYFGYSHPNGDLDLEDFRSREQMWKQSSLAVDFLQQHVPFAEMKHDDGLVSGAPAFVLAQRDASYAVYLPQGGQASLDLTGATGSFTVRWFDPRAGGALLSGSVATVTGGAARALGVPPSAPAADWVALVQK